MKTSTDFQTFKFEPHVWYSMGFDNEYYQNTALLNLQTVAFEDLLPGLSREDANKIIHSEHESLVLAITRTYPTFFFYSCQ